jgi:NAD(P)-dependent dehydrogenase (short-subunit alcohol dehydrogenase family)
MVDHPNPKKLLVIGGTSILSESLAQLARNERYEIDTTTRDGKSCSYASNQYELDLGSLGNVETFLERILMRKYHRIIVITGEASGIEVNSNATDAINAYYTTHLTNTVYLIDKLLMKLETPGNLIYISSIAASNSSFDCHYSAVKAGVSAYLKSRSRFLDTNQSSFSIAPSLIEGTKMYLDMSPETVANHLVRNKGRLTSVDEISRYVWAQNPEISLALNGKLISVGNEY